MVEIFSGKNQRRPQNTFWIARLGLQNILSHPNLISAFGKLLCYEIGLAATLFPSAQILDHFKGAGLD